MSGKTKSKGSFGSKQVVKCRYCEETSRKDNLERHINTKHPGELFKFSYIEVSFGIKNFLKVVDTPNRNSDSNESETCDQEIKPSKICEAKNEPSKIEDPKFEQKGGLNDKDLKLKGQNYFSENPSGSKPRAKRYAIMIIILIRNSKIWRKI